MGKEKYTLHFYPDERRLDVKNGSGSVVTSFEAWGGNMDEVANGTPGYEATNKGTFIVQVIGPVTTSRWGYSKIAWGETVRIRPTDWAVFDRSGKKILHLAQPEYENFSFIYSDMPDVLRAAGIGETVTVPYRFNDFGHVGIKTYIDVNGNNRYDNDIDTINPHYIHPTTLGEWNKINDNERGNILDYSHGCIHMYPSDIDELISKYVTRKVTTLTVH